MAENAALRTALDRQVALSQQLTRIRRTLTRRAPLHQVREAIVHGASQVLGDEVVGLRKLDDHDRDELVIIASVGLDGATAAAARRSPVGAGAGGRAVCENRVVVIGGY